LLPFIDGSLCHKAVASLNPHATGALVKKHGYFAVASQVGNESELKCLSTKESIASPYG
jgi:hypothetical protein